MDEGNRYTHHRVEEGDRYTQYNVKEGDRCPHHSVVEGHWYTIYSMDEGDRYTHHSVEEGDWYTHHSVDVGHIEADAGEEVADRVHHEYRVPTSRHRPQVGTRTTTGDVQWDSKGLGIYVGQTEKGGNKYWLRCFRGKIWTTVCCLQLL
jgi:hypothetical protein